MRVRAGADKEPALFCQRAVERRLLVGVAAVVTLDAVHRRVGEHAVQRLLGHRRTEVGTARVGDDANPASLVRRLDNDLQRRIRREVPTQLDHQLRRLLQTRDVLVGDHRAEHVYGH